MATLAVTDGNAVYEIAAAASMSTSPSCVEARLFINLWVSHV